MVGVPALWELLHRRIKNRFYERSDWIGKTAENLMYVNAWLRDRTSLNLGQVLFFRADSVGLPHGSPAYCGLEVINVSCIVADCDPKALRS